jgi:uncharacterized DUF497 family protein
VLANEQPSGSHRSNPWTAARSRLLKNEFNHRKSEANKQKHGIDFVTSQALWDDPNLIEIPARITDERRFLVVGKVGDGYWSGMITYRGKNIRIISVRRARREEVAIYES